MEFVENIPIYRQIMTLIKQRIVNHTYHAGEKVPAVRELALQLETNPNTVQRALSDLENEGVLFSKRGLGRFVSEDEAVLESMKMQTVQEKVANFVLDLQAFGLDESQIQQVVAQYLAEGRGNDGD
ncbi:MAG TPA: GntR family transcriptional regulator [Lactobacillaceae bacterium]|jgi:GntR family transcriptional regulator